jgi:hypothetical protein
MLSRYLKRKLTTLLPFSQIIFRLSVTAASLLIILRMYVFIYNFR